MRKLTREITKAPAKKPAGDITYSLTPSGTAALNVTTQGAAVLPVTTKRPSAPRLAINASDTRLRKASETLYRDMPDKDQFTVEQVEKAIVGYLTDTVWCFLYNPNLLAAARPAMLQGNLIKARNG